MQTSTGTPGIPQFEWVAIPDGPSGAALLKAWRGRVGSTYPQQLLRLSHNPSHKVREIMANGADGLDCQTKKGQLKATKFDLLDTKGRT